jgi:putative ABC transport system permease protein
MRRLLYELRENFAISWQAIWANKLRSGLTTLGIVIGIVSVTLMGTALESLNAAFLRSISAIGTDVFIVDKYPWFNNEPWWKMRNRRDVVLADGLAFARQANPAWQVNLEAMTGRTIKHENRSASGVMVLGSTDDGAAVNGLTVVEGRYLSGPEVDGGRPVCVIGADIATNFFPRMSPLGQKLKVDDSSYEIIGVLERRGSFLGMVVLDNQLYIPITRFMSHHSYRPRVMVKVKVGRLTGLEDAQEEIRGLMRKVRRLEPGAVDDFAVNSQEMFIQTFNRMAGVVASVGFFITSLSLFVGGIGIMNIMFVSVAERTREIGIRKAIGAKRRTILLQFLMEAAGVCLIGGFIGLGISWSITKILSAILSEPMFMSPTVVGVALLVSVMTGVIAGFLPAWRAARMKPVDALRNE